EEGIVPGGGVVLVRSQSILRDGLGLTGDTLTGVRIVERALEEPFRQICENAGKVGELILEKVRTMPTNHGYDARNDRFVDMLEAGIVDPAKVTRSALQNAASIAAMVLTTEAVVAEIPEEKKDTEPVMGEM